MAGPFSLLLLSGGLKANAALQEGQQQKQFADFNAGVTAVQAEEARAWSVYNERRLREQQAANRGEMLVNLLNKGFSLDEGTTGDLLLREQEFQDELAALTVRNEGEAQRAGLLNRAAAFRFKGKLDEEASRTEALTLFGGSAVKATQVAIV